MSIFYLGTDADSLADKMAAAIDEGTRGGDCFVSIPIVVPNRYVGKWLRLWLARRLGVAINLRFQYLETFLWDLLKALDGRPQSLPVGALDHNTLRTMILSLLLNEAEKQPALTPLGHYLGWPSQGQQANNGRQLSEGQRCRRAWQLAERLASLFRDYEYHRQDLLIQKWLLEPTEKPSDHRRDDLEQAQGELYRRIVCSPDGLQSLLSRGTNQLLLTLPQYALEVMNLPPQQLREPSGPRGAHLFGITQVSALHIHILRWLGERYDLRLYHLNPLAGRLLHGCPARQAREQTTAHQLRFAIHKLQLDGLLACWGQAGQESLKLMADLWHEGGWQVESVISPQPLAAGRPPLADRPQPTPDRRSPTADNRPPIADRRPHLLRRLQEDLLGWEQKPDRLPQDRSLQIVACPGIYREVETVYNSIVHNLHHDPDLKQTDIAVLVTDMARYRPVLQAVFDRQPRRLQYNLADFSAAGLSAFGDALLGLLDLALESFSRSRVFAVLLNPCYLARMGVDRDQAMTWLKWAELLGIYHGWDQADRQQRGYHPGAGGAVRGGGPLYSWRLGLQRLRLGQLMTVVDEDTETPALRYGSVIPFADLSSGDKEQLEAFNRAVQGLLPYLARLGSCRLSGREWAARLQEMIQEFLAVPPDRPDEEEVRDQLLRALEQLALFDQVSGSAETRLPLGLIREFVQANLETLVGTRGEYLTGGVTISALQPLRPVPFQVIYMVGLGEGLFPGSNTLPALDLRSRQRSPGDIHLAESNRFLFLEALLAARQKIYLLYNSRDLQKDQILHPCSPVNQLRHYAEEHLLEGAFQAVPVPLNGNDPRYVCPDANNEKWDVLVNYSEAERLRALADGQRTEGLRLEGCQAAEVARRLQQARPSFAMPPSVAAAGSAIPTITLRELGQFLRCPAEAAIRRHLRLADDEETELADDEPFYTGRRLGSLLVLRGLQRFVRQAAQGSVEEALGGWRSGFAALYEDYRLRGRLPDGAFAQVDQARLEEILYQRISGPAGLASFLGERAGFCGPVLLGENNTPIGARQHFPALVLPLPTARDSTLPPQVRLVGFQTFVWRSEQALDILVLTSSKKVQDHLLSVPMFEPLLFVLALKAATAEWLGERELRLHLANEEKIRRFVYLPDDMPAATAANYLAALSSDYLDRSSFDLLPFELVAARPQLCEAFSTLVPQAGETLLQLRQDYARRFQEALEEDADQEHPDYWPMGLLEVVDVRVPDDAWDKIQRRFRLLNTGPARERPGTTAEGPEE